jgi:DNA-binding transcriptional ArsR family regulator
MKQISVIRIYQISAAIILLIALSMSICAAQDDNQSTDSDEDGLPDYWEEQYFGNSTNYGASDDPDMDDLTNLEEYQIGTNPTMVDTDMDGMPDWWEVQYGLDPLDYTDSSADTDGDGFSNTDEYKGMSNPNDKHSYPKESADKKDGDGENEALDMMALPIILFGVPIVVILLAVMFVYTKMRREQLLEHNVRANIYEYINKNPGVHYRGIMNDLNLQMGVLTHHLNMLEQERYIKSAQDGMYRRFYSFNAPVNSGLVLNDVQEKILQHIRDRPGISQADVARNLGYTRKVVYYHVKILSNAGFIHVETAGRESRCFYIEGLDFGQPATGAGVSAQVQGS